MPTGWLLLAGVLASPLLAGTDIRHVEGGVAVYLPNLNDWRPISKVPFGLVAGDRIRLKPLSKAEITFEDGTWVRASQDAVFKVKQDDEAGTAIELESGRLDVSVKRLRDHVFEVFAPGAKVTLRADRASIQVTNRKVVVVEVTRGLADVAPAVGPPVQVPDEHRLEIPPGKAPGLPMPLKELKHVIQKLPSAPPGSTRKYERKAQRADPSTDEPQPKAAKAKPAEELGADGLGLPKPPPEAPAPKLGTESLGLEPELGNASLGIKEPRAAPSDAPALGGKALGLKEPPPEPKAPPKKPAPPKTGPEYYKSKPVPTDISPLMDFGEFGVKKPKPRPKEAAPKAEPAPKKKTKVEPETPAQPEYYKPKTISTDISPLIEAPRK